MKRSRRKTKKIKKYYNRQNALIDAYLGSHEEEQAEVEDTIQNGGKVKFAVNASFVVNFFLFIIQMYAAISTGSLSLFATAADAFVRIPISNVNISILWLILFNPLDGSCQFHSHVGYISVGSQAKYTEIPRCKYPRLNFFQYSFNISTRVVNVLKLSELFSSAL